MKKFYVTISGSWLAACGKGNLDTTCEVIRTLPKTLPDGSHIYVVDFGGREWTVAEWRCLGPARRRGVRDVPRVPVYFHDRTGKVIGEVA